MTARTAAELPLWYNAVEILERNLEDRADATALITAERSWTFAEISAEVNRVGNALLSMGVRPGERVGILCPDTAEWAVTFFACLKVGAVAVGMNTLLTPREIHLIHQTHLDIGYIRGRGSSLRTRLCSLRRSRPSPRRAASSTS